MDRLIEDRWPRIHLLVGLVVLCAMTSSCGSETTGGPSPGDIVEPGQPGASPSPTASAPSDPSAVPMPSPRPPSGALEDGSSDVTPAFLDIVRLEASAADGSLNLGMTLADSAPTGSPLVGVLAYRFYLDTDDDGAWNWVVALDLVPGGGYVPSIADRAGSRESGPAFPGTVNLSGGRISMTVPLDALGCPSVIGVRAMAEQTKSSATVRDEAPDRPDQWSRVQTGC
jgi:hypothetical protein